MRQLLPTAFLATLVGACAAEVAGEHVGHLGGPIVGGETLAAHPFAVALTHHGIVRCTGILIAPDEVLTAAHCAAVVPLRASMRASEAGGFEDRRVVEAVLHPRYGPGQREADLAWLRLAGPLPGAPPPFLDATVGPELEGTVVRVLGFGTARAGLDEGSGRLRAGNARVVEVTGAEIRLAAAPGSPCAGDSGGPVLVEGGAPGPWVIGVIRGGGIDCTEATAARVDVHIEELLEEVEDRRADRAGCGVTGPAAHAPPWLLLLIVAAVRVGQRARSARCSWYPAPQAARKHRDFSWHIPCSRPCRAHGAQHKGVVAMIVRRSWCVLAIIPVAWASAASAQTDYPFTTYHSFEGIDADLSFEIDVRAADLDRDGDTDIVANTGLSGLLWLENEDGHGHSFEMRIIDEIGVDDFVLHDLDGDEDLDIVATFDDLLWFENLEGGRAFRPNLIASSPEGDFALVGVGDADADGDPDVFHGGDVLSLFRNLSGDGSDWSSATVVSGREPTSLAVHDFDLDGDADAAMGYARNDERYLRVLENQGGPWAEVDLPMQSTPVTAELEDVDGDGDMDMLLCTEQSVLLMENLGDLVFGTDELLGPEYMPLAMWRAAFGDVDADGDRDILATSVHHYVGLTLLENVGGGYEEQVLDERRFSAGGIAVTDMDCDGDADLVFGVSDWSTSQVQTGWWENETRSADTESCHGRPPRPGPSCEERGDCPPDAGAGGGGGSGGGGDGPVDASVSCSAGRLNGGAGFAPLLLAGLALLLRRRRRPGQPGGARQTSRA